MSTSHSVSEWVRGVAGGDRQAVVHLWRRYYGRLVQFARRRFHPATAICDEEDLASRTLQSFLARAERGCFMSLENRRELWCLLTTIALRKAANTRRHSLRRRRRADATQSLSDDETMEHPARSESPEDAACLRERYTRVIGALDRELRTIIDDRIHGYTNVEIAARINRSVPTVERRMRLIREKCREEGISCLIE